MSPSPSRVAKAHQRKASRDQRGFTILEVVAAMAIVLALAGIALFAFSQYRARAYESGATSDARAIGLELDANFTDTQSYPSTVGPQTKNQTGPYKATYGGAESDLDAKITKGNWIKSYAVTTDGTSGFCIIVEHVDGAWAQYDSIKGGIVARERDGAPATGCTPGNP